jgi:hypothetical protein
MQRRQLILALCRKRKEQLPWHVIDINNCSPALLSSICWGLQPLISKSLLKDQKIVVEKATSTTLIENEW